MVKLEKNIIENIYQSKYEELDEKIIKKIKENKNKFLKIKDGINLIILCQNQ